MRNRIYTDLLKTDDEGHLLLTAQGTVRDLKSQGIELSEGLRLLLYTDDADDQGNRDDLVFAGITMWSDDLAQWVVEINRDNIRHISELNTGQ
jgi:hypothetical protein